MYIRRHDLCSFAFCGFSFSKFGGSFASRQAPRHSKGGGMSVMNLVQQAGHMDFRYCAARMEGERWKVAQCIQVHAIAT